VYTVGNTKFMKIYYNMCKGMFKGMLQGMLSHEIKSLFLNIYRIMSMNEYDYKMTKWNVFEEWWWEKLCCPLKVIAENNCITTNHCNVWQLLCWNLLGQVCFEHLIQLVMNEYG